MALARKNERAGNEVHCLISGSIVFLADPPSFVTLDGSK
jgi:hypothetical protein